MFQPAKSERSPHEPRQNNGTGRHHCRRRVGRLRAGVPVPENPAVLKIVLLEAGFDAARPEDFPDLASPYPGRAYSNPTYTWPGLKASLPYRGSNYPEGCVTRTSRRAS